jgi:SAM-dependent methyltransferase
MTQFEDNLHPRLRRTLDPRKSGSTVHRLRLKRFEIFREFIADLPRPVQVLDLGGEEVFWKQMGLVDPSDIRVTLLNRYLDTASGAAFTPYLGDATAMPEFEDQSFEVVFSNSVIEHVGDWEAQGRMAEESMRVGKRYFIQTPNKYFPIEPHFLVPFFQFYPLSLRVWLLQRFHLGWYPAIPDRETAREHIRSHRLLDRRELVKLFPGCRIFEEKIFGLTKSYIAMSPE